MGILSDFKRGVGEITSGRAKKDFQHGVRVIKRGGGDKRHPFRTVNRTLTRKSSR